MSTDQSETEDNSLEDAANPLQFRLLELFGLMTVVALACAMAAPVFRGFDSEFLRILVAIVTFQFSFAVWVAYREGNKRNAFLDNMGERFGVGFCGQLPWKYWPITRAVIGSVYLALLQVSVAAQMSHELVEHGSFFGPFATAVDQMPASFVVLEKLHAFTLIGFLYYLQLAWYTGWRFARFRSRVYPNSIEFFANGISRPGLYTAEWDCVEVRESKLFPDRITLLIRQTPDSVAATTLVVQVSDSLRAKIFSASCL